MLIYIKYISFILNEIYILSIYLSLSNIFLFLSSYKLVKVVLSILLILISYTSYSSIEVKKSSIEIKLRYMLTLPRINL